MRIFLLLLIIGISFTVSFSKRTKNSTSTLSPKTTKTNDVTVTKQSGTTKTPRDSRGKRTLYDIGTYPYQPIQISRRIGGYSDPRAYYPQEIAYQQPQYAPYPSFIPEPSNHLPPEYHHGYYPQYIEPPEPIIEIIIKESNETLNLPPPQQIVHKKKKEKVQVFYVNYKKDKNNKLLLESPIASLEHNKHQDENDEEEIINYPVVTALPPVKTTTLRTVIHPESEQYHSNSGIHVSFGTEDKHQSGHELQEHNEESVIRSVVALPNQNNYIRDEHRASEQQRHRVSQQSQNYHGVDQRFYESQQPSFHITDLGPSEPVNNFDGNQFNKHHYQIAQQSSKPDIPPAQHYVSQHLQLPVSHQNQPFRNFINQYHVTHTLNNQQSQQYQPQHKQQQQQHQQQPQIQHQQQQQQQSYAPLEIIQKYDPRPRVETQPAKYNVQSESQQENYISHSRPDVQQQIKHNEQQHYQQRPEQQVQVQQTQPIEQSLNQQEQYQERPLARLTPFPTKQSIRFPFQSFATQKQQALPQYQPVKFRPTVSPQTQSQHAKQPDQQKYQRQPNIQQQQPRPTQKPFNPFPIFGLPNQNKKKSETKATSTYNSYNQQQFPFKQPNPSPTQQSQSQYVQNQAAPRPQEQYQSQYTSNQGQAESVRQHSANLGPLQSLFSGPTQSELVSSVPRFEQHITEFVKSPSEQQSQINTNSGYNEFSFRNKNQVIQNIPAPKLGPTSPNPFNYQSTPAPQQQNTGENYVISSTPNYNTYVQQQDQQRQYVSSIPQQQHQSSTPQYIQTNNGQQIQIVTPLPNTQFHNQGQQQQTQLATSGSQPIIIPNSQPRQQQQTENNYAATGQSVSTLHTDAFYDLEQKRNEYFVQQEQHQQAQYQQKQEPQNYVTIQARNKYSAESLQEKNQNTIKSTLAPSTTSTTQTPSSTTEKATAPKKSNLELPDEVPEELRQQLLSSGILDNADISVLDYDKVGDIALENLPPEHLAHFYGNGGGAQIAGSHKVLSVVRPNGEKVNFSEKQIDRVKQTQILPKKQNVDLKVVRFDSTNQKSVTDKFVKSDSTILPPVNISTEKQYNRYLPLKVSGAQFPIPDADELKGKKISSVVVLAPVDSLQNVSDEIEGRQERDVFDSKGVKFVAGDSLKQLIKKPSSDNFKKWLERESKTEIDLQSVVLLVTGASESDKEIFMYDIGTQSINKLNGELSTAFVNVAEENASSEDLENVKITDSGIIEKMLSDNSSKEIEDQKNDDLSPGSSNLYETVVKLSDNSGTDKRTSSKTTNNEKISIT